MKDNRFTILRPFDDTNEVKPSYVIFLSNLPKHSKEEDIRETFAGGPEIEHVDLKYVDDNIHKGMATLYLKNETEIDVFLR